MNPAHITQYTLSSVCIEPVSKQRALRIIRNRYKKPIWVTTLNPEYILYARRHNSFARLIESSDIQLIDGIGLKWGLEVIAGANTVEHVPGVEFFMDAIRESGPKRILLLGSRKSILYRVASKLIDTTELTREHIALLDGYNDLGRARNVIRSFNPDLVFVGLGSPMQDRWIHTHMQLDSTPRVYVGIGGAFDILGGRWPRAPLFIRKMHLEWLWRGLIQPSRLPRTVRAAVFFPFYIDL